MIKPVELESAEGKDIWNTLTAAAAGDAPALRHLLERNARLAKAEYWYAPAVHFAAREGHVDAVRLLLEAEADPERNGLNDRNLIEMARERGHEEIAQMLERARDRRGRVVAQKLDHPIHRAAGLGDAKAVSSLLDADASIIDRGNRLGLTPLHLAVLGGSRPVVTLLFDRGANLDARGGGGDLQAIDLAVWGWRGKSGNPDIARLLISCGATYDLPVAAALGDLYAVRQKLDESPSRIREARPSGRRPLSAAVESGHDDVARLLLERGADPTWDEPNAPRGTALHAASQMGNLTMVKALLDHGADPNEDIDSAASALAFAATPEIRALLESHGADIGLFDPKWVENDDELRRVASEAFTMNADRADLLARMLSAGLRMPAVHTACQGYLLNADALRTLLAHGMSPDQMNWQHQTLLHHASTRSDSECAAILLNAGATITARDDEYRSTPLGWAARVNSLTMVEFLLSHGAPTNLPDDAPWATPLAWATRRGHSQIVEMLRIAGATA
ncbi:MAG TPA: ankyrin repeat domain-containing protein [Terriglobia bacterium]|nr:ankyrin repeat domain-containing protein [Terriglobia bacterium]